MSAISYDDIRYFLAVASKGTTLSAGRELKVSQSTVSRRIAALEEALGVELFDKRRDGYCINETGQRLLTSARAAHEAFEAFAREGEAEARAVDGVVRLTTNEMIAAIFLPDLATGLRRHHPNIGLEVDTTDQQRDLGNGEADVAIRACSRPTAGDLVGRKIADDHWGFYCSADYASRHGVPRDVSPSYS